MPSAKEFPLQGAEETVELVLHTGLCLRFLSLALPVRLIHLFQNHLSNTVNKHDGFSNIIGEHTIV